MLSWVSYDILTLMLLVFPWSVGFESSRLGSLPPTAVEGQREGWCFFSLARSVLHPWRGPASRPLAFLPVLRSCRRFLYAEQ